MSELEKPVIRKRSLNVMIMLFSFSLLPFSGIVIHSTHGMNENEPLRHFAMSVHNLSAIIFFVTCIIHLLANRTTLSRYISEKTARYLQLKREALIALVFVITLVGLFSMHAFHVR